MYDFYKCLLVLCLHTLWLFYVRLAWCEGSDGWSSYLMCLIKLICSNLGIRWTLGGLTHPIFHTQALNRLTMDSLSNAPYIQKVTQEPHSVHKSDAINIFLPASSICMLSVVTCDTRISETSWVLVQYSCGTPFWSITETAQFYLYCCCSDYRPKVACLQTFICMTFSKWGVLPGFCISTKVGCHISQWYGSTSEYFYHPSLLTSGDSTDTPGLNAEGITGRVLLILTEVISLVVWIIGILFMAVWFYEYGKHIPV